MADNRACRSLSSFVEETSRIGSILNGCILMWATLLTFSETSKTSGVSITDKSFTVLPSYFQGFLSMDTLWLQIILLLRVKKLNCTQYSERNVDIFLLSIIVQFLLAFLHNVHVFKSRSNHRVNQQQFMFSN